MNVDEAIRNYRLIRSRRKTMSLGVDDKGVIVRAPQFVPRSSVDRFVKDNRSWIEKHLEKMEASQEQFAGVEPLTAEELRALADQAVRVIPERVQHFAALLGVNYGRITIRCQKTRWGSCSAKGNLNFNVLLMLTPPEVIDSVVVHELCHRKEMNHSARFYEEVLRVFPEYHKYDKWLKENGPVIMARAKNFH